MIGDKCVPQKSSRRHSDPDHHLPKPAHSVCSPSLPWVLRACKSGGAGHRLQRSQVCRRMRCGDPLGPITHDKTQDICTVFCGCLEGTYYIGQPCSPHTSSIAATLSSQPSEGRGRGLALTLEFSKSMSGDRGLSLLPSKGLLVSQGPSSLGCLLETQTLRPHPSSADQNCVLFLKTGCR